MSNTESALLEVGTAYLSGTSEFFVLSYYVSLRSEFRIVMSVKNCAKTNVPFIFASSCLFFLRYLCLFAYSGV